MNKNYEANIWKLYLFRILSVSEFAGTIYVLFLLSNNLSMTQIMVLESIFMLTILFSEIPSGAFADIVGRKHSLTIYAFLSSLGFLIIGINQNFWILLIAQIIIGIGWSMESGANSALTYDTLKELKKEKDYQKIWGFNLFLLSLSLGVSAIISTLLASFIGFNNLFFITALTIGSAGIVSMTIKEPNVYNKINQANYLKHIKEAIQFTKKHKIIKNLIIYFALFSSISHMSWFLISPYYNTKGPLILVGIAIFLYFVLFGIGTIIPSKYYNKISENSLFLILLLFSGICFIFIPLSSIIISLVLLSIMSILCGIRDIKVDTSINHHTSSYHRATVYSIKSFSKGLVYAIISPIIGIVSDKISIDAGFILFGILLIIMFIYYKILNIFHQKL